MYKYTYLLSYLCVASVSARKVIDMTRNCMHHMHKSSIYRISVKIPHAFCHKILYPKLGSKFFMRFSPKGVFFIWLGIHKSIPPKSAPKKSYLPKIQGGGPPKPPPSTTRGLKSMMAAGRHFFDARDRAIIKRVERFGRVIHQNTCFGLRIVPLGFRKINLKIFTPKMPQNRNFGALSMHFLWKTKMSITF